MIHGPSMVIGAAITAISLVAVFFTFGLLYSTEIELASKEIPTKTIDFATLAQNGSPVYGDINAPITMIEFGDYQCHFCNVFFHETKDKILENYVDTGKVNMIFKDFTIIGSDSVNAAHGAHCANDQGKYWEYHDALYNNWTGENNGWASSENLLKFAQSISLDTDKWRDCMNTEKYQQKIIENNVDAKALGLTGTPAFFIIGTDGKASKVSGARSFETFEEIFDSIN